MDNWIYIIFAFYIKLCFGINLKEEIYNLQRTYHHMSDQKIMGDLYYMQGPFIQTLTWIVEIHPNCKIESLINFCKKFNDSNIENNVCNKSDLKLILIKILQPFNQTYLLAHPYFRLYNKFKSKYKKFYKRLISKLNIYKNFNFKKETSHIIKEIWTSNDFLPLNKKYIFNNIVRCINSCFKNNPCILYADQEILQPRFKRTKVNFKDPLFKQQWHLKNKALDEYDINVFGAWESGITGRGITVCVIDDGLEWRHADLQDNYNPAGSYDLNADDFDPSPVKDGDKNEHGTRCAGEIAAVANNVCGVGVAYRANISGIRVLGDRMTDSMEASAFVQGLNINDIYSCSWGPNDDGKTVDGPRTLAKKALLHGVTYGRNGYGAIYVVASGNGGRNKDNCNYDGYANSVYTVTIGAVDSRGTMPYYAEECATMLAVTPSSGSNGKAIVTTDWQGSNIEGCTSHHSGTSAAAPLAAAVIALALEMQPCLSWRDVQYLIALTSRKIDLKNSNWIVNKAGLHHSHQHGFGLMDATGIVSAAAVWESVPFSTSYSSKLITVNKDIPTNAFHSLIVNHSIQEDTINSYALSLLEYVQVYVSLEHEYRGSLRISLTCPSGTKSVLASPRIKDNSTSGLQHWPLGTVRCWGESSWGSYSLEIQQTYKRKFRGKLLSWQVVIRGSPMTKDEFQKRKRMVKRALKGEVVHVNRSILCHPPELNFEPLSALSEQTIKILVIFGFFLFVLNIYNSLEYLFCYNKEKKMFYQHLKDLAQSHILQQNRNPITTNTLDLGRSDSNDLECESLLFSNTEIYLGKIHEGAVSPTASCEADVSSLSGDSDRDDDDGCSSRNTSDTVVPRDTTDFTTTTTELTASEPDDIWRSPLFNH